MPRAPTSLKVILAFAAVLVIAAFGLSSYTIHTMRRTFEASAARSRTALAAHHQQFMDDQKVLARLPLFQVRSGKRDAGPLIGPRVRWRLATSAASSASTPLMPDATAVEALGDRWAHAGPDTWAGLDFGWMAQLRGYDLWDLERNSLRPDPRFFTDPEPDSRDLWAWTKLRIAKGVHDGAVEAAVTDVQELARLCYTTERLGTELAGVVIQGLVRLALERLGAPMPVSQVDFETSGRIRRAILGAIAFARLETPSFYEDDFTRIAVGRCAALHDGMYAALVLRPQLGRSRADDFQRMERLLAAAPECRLTWLREEWARPDDDRLREGGDWLHRVTMRWIPGSRQFWGEVLVGVGEQEWFKAYEERGK